MEDTETLLYVYGFGLLFFIGALVFFILNIKELIRLKQTKYTKVAALKKGFCKIKGKVVKVAPLLKSPLSQVACVYFGFNVKEVVRKASTDSYSWESFLSDGQSVVFGVADDSGIAHIAANSTTMNLHDDVRVKSNVLNKPTEEMVNALKHYDKEEKLLSRLRYSEDYLEVGDEVHVLGEVIDFDGGVPIFGIGKEPCLISDKSADEITGGYLKWIIWSFMAMVAIAWGLVKFTVANQ